MLEKAYGRDVTGDSGILATIYIEGTRKEFESNPKVKMARLGQWASFRREYVGVPAGDGTMEIHRRCLRDGNLYMWEVSSCQADAPWVLDINVKGLIFASRHAIPIMLEQGGGVILFTASKTGLVAQKDSPVYCASKGAAVMLAKALALDYATQGIRVNALCPGIIDTPMVRDFAEAMPDPAAAWNEYSLAQPIGRLGTPQECADAAVWLASDEASFITGVALPVDGGFTAM